MGVMTDAAVTYGILPPCPMCWRTLSVWLVIVLPRVTKGGKCMYIMECGFDLCVYVKKHAGHGPQRKNRYGQLQQTSNTITHLLLSIRYTVEPD